MDNYYESLNIEKDIENFAMMDRLEENQRYNDSI